MARRFIVTADPPTPNGDLHVGHLSGPYFAADVLTRALRLQGHEVAFYSYFDSHQTYVVTTALRLGTTAQEVVDRFSRRIAATLEANAIEPDLMAFPDERQKAFVRRFYEDLYEKGKLLVRDEELPYCTHCRLYLFETYVQGTCPHCSAECYGNTCEICVLPNCPKDMGHPRCRHCGRPPAERRSYRGLFLPLSRYQKELEAFVESRRGIWRPRFFENFRECWSSPLPDIPLSMVCDYGLPVSIPGFPGQVYNVRQEILPALIETFDKWRESRPGAFDWRDGGARVVHFHGFENAFQYCVSFNTQVIASDLGWDLPYANIANEFYLLEGSKFSTTRNHAIWGSELLEVVPSDHVRFYLALTNPELEETNLALEDFRVRTDELLTKPWNEVVRRVGALVANGAPAGGEITAGAELGARLDRLSGDMAEAYSVESFSLQKAARHWSAFLAELAERTRSIAPGDVLTQTLPALRALAVFAKPLMPRFSDRLLGSLAASGDGETSWESFREPVSVAAVGLGEDLSLASLAEIDLSRFAKAPHLVA